MNIANTETASKSAARSPEQVKEKERLAVEMANNMPAVRIVRSDEDVGNSAAEWEFLGHVSVSLDRGYLVVEPVVKGSEIYNASRGTHTVYGNFIHVWSVRGPGEEPCQRPMFLFHDNEAVFL